MINNKLINKFIFISMFFCLLGVYKLEAGGKIRRLRKFTDDKMDNLLRRLRKAPDDDVFIRPRDLDLDMDTALDALNPKAHNAANQYFNQLVQKAKNMSYEQRKSLFSDAMERQRLYQRSMDIQASQAEKELDRLIGRASRLDIDRAQQQVINFRYESMEAMRKQSRIQKLLNILEETH